MSAETIVYIVDDDEGIRKALSLLLKSSGHKTKPCATAQEFLENFDPSTPGCMLLDIRMPGMSGLELQERLKSYNIHIPVIIMTGHGDISMAVKAMKNGARDFIEKPFANQRVLDAVNKGLAEFTESWQLQEDQRDTNERLAQLTPREREVMDLLLEGKLNKQVAAKLFISVRTVERHRLNGMKKLKIRSLMELANMMLVKDNMGRSVS